MLKKVLLGFGFPLLIVLCNGILAWRLGGPSHSHFTWEAFAQVYVATPTSTPTATPTVTPTATATPLGLGLSCAVGAQCGSGFCVNGVCCVSACSGANETCAAPGKVGFCTAPAPAPALSFPLLWLLVTLLIVFGAFNLHRVLAGRRHH